MPLRGVFILRCPFAWYVYSPYANQLQSPH